MVTPVATRRLPGPSIGGRRTPYRRTPRRKSAAPPTANGSGPGEAAATLLGPPVDDAPLSRTGDSIDDLLDRAGLEPGFLVGGVPLNFGTSARLGALGDDASSAAEQVTARAQQDRAEERARVRDRLHALMEEIAGMPSDPEGEPWSLFLALHPERERPSG